MDLPPIPEWEGEPKEFGAVPESDEVDVPLTRATAVWLQWVLEKARLYDPAFEDQLLTL